MTSAELLTALNKIEEMGFHDCLRLIHFHIGSQITKSAASRRLSVRQHSSTSTSTRWATM